MNQSRIDGHIESLMQIAREERKATAQLIACVEAAIRLLSSDSHQSTSSAAIDTLVRSRAEILAKRPVEYHLFAMILSSLHRCKSVLFDGVRTTRLDDGKAIVDVVSDERELTFQCSLASLQPKHFGSIEFWGKYGPLVLASVEAGRKPTGPFLGVASTASVLKSPDSRRSFKIAQQTFPLLPDCCRKHLSEEPAATWSSRPQLESWRQHIQHLVKTSRFRCHECLSCGTKGTNGFDAFGIRSHFHASHRQQSHQLIDATPSPKSTASIPQGKVPGTPLEPDSLKYLRILEAELLSKLQDLSHHKSEDRSWLFSHVHIRASRLREHINHEDRAVRAFAISLTQRVRTEIDGAARPIWISLEKVRWRALTPQETDAAKLALEYYKILRDNFASEMGRIVSYLEHLLKGDVRTHCYKCHVDIWRSEQTRCDKCRGNFCPNPKCNSCLCGYYRNSPRE